MNFHIKDVISFMFRTAFDAKNGMWTGASIHWAAIRWWVGLNQVAKTCSKVLYDRHNQNYGLL